jgi:alkylation response protein AidB-like acyl-CoA dehydrogenase
MAKYQVPIRDMRFVLHEFLQVEENLGHLQGFEDLSTDVVDAVLEEASRLCEDVIFPTNRAGDDEGCRFDNGVVRTPTGFKEAYKALSDGGWTALACDTEFGGQGLPETLGLFIDEMVGSANMAFGLYPILTHGAYLGMIDTADTELKQRFLPNMVSGKWTGTMCLTEPHCGTDLGLLRTRAELIDGTRYALTGTKIFITGGEHDLTENIIHLVLARTPDAPPGIKGISMFAVPKFLVKDDCSLGARNGVSCGSIEKKMGIKGASTCVLNFDAAEGYLVGELHRGMRAMFTMMNHERVVVGLQGLSQAEVAYQSAADYAQQRLQSRSLSGPKYPDQPADPIIVHPDVRRMLLTTRANNEAARALAGWLGMEIDLLHKHPDTEVREKASDLVALLTPVVKSFFTDLGSEACNLCLQVLGGHGYIKEWGMEQLVRDARIAQIYEGTNGIQALDLVGRKLSMHDGRLTQRYFHMIESFISEHRELEELAEFVQPLDAALANLVETTDWLKEAAGQDREELGAAASDYLRLMGLVTFAFIWAKIAKVAIAKGKQSDDDFYRHKLATARFFMDRLLPENQSLAVTIRSGASSLMALADGAF